MNRNLLASKFIKGNLPLSIRSLTKLVPKNT